MRTDLAEGGDVELTRGADKLHGAEVVAGR